MSTSLHLFKNFSLIGLLFTLISACTPEKKDFSTQACLRENLNCTGPSTTVDMVGGDKNISNIGVDGSDNDVGSVAVKSIRFGEFAIVEFLIKNPKLIPLKDFSLKMTPQDPAYTIISGISAKSCANGLLTYQQTCSVAIKYKPARTPPDVLLLQFNFKTITGADFRFKSSFDPAVLLPDFYIAESSLSLANTMIYSTGNTSTGVTSDVEIENPGSKENLTIASLGFKSKSCNILSGTGDDCTVGSVLTAKSADTCKIRVAFKPTERGHESCVFEVIGTNGTYRSYVFKGHGVGLKANVENIDFGIMKPAASSVKKTAIITIEADSLSTAASSCTLDISPADSAFVVADLPFPSSLSSSTRNIEVTFTPQGVSKTHRTEVIIACDSRGGTLKIPLSAATSPNNLTSNASDVDFGDVLVGETATKTITITNSSSSETVNDVTSTISSTMGPEYSITSSTCGASLAPSASCTITVLFAPTTGGPSQNALSVSGTGEALVPAISLSGSGLGLKSDPNSLDFGTLKFNTDRPGPILTVTNIGTGKAEGCTLSSDSMKDTGFSIDTELDADGKEIKSTCLTSTSLDPSATCTISPRFTAATTEGTFESQIKMTCTKGGTLQIPLKAIVKANLSLVLVPPNDLNWADRLVGVNETYEFQFMNQGDKSLSSVAVTPEGLSSPWSSTANTCSGSLDVGQICKYTLAYAPSATPGSEQAGSTSGKLTGSATGSDSPVATFAATAKKIAASQNTLAFGQVQTGSDLLANTRVYFENPSSVDTASSCSLSSLADFEIADTDCGSSLNPSSQCSVQIKLPAKSSSVDLAESLHYTCGVGGRASVSISASVKKNPVLAWSGTSAYSFVDIGSSKDVEFTLTHTGVPADLPATSLLISLDAAVTPFTIKSNNCPTSLAGGASCKVTVTFAPLVEGAQSVNLTATSQIAPVSLNLTGTGVDPAKRLTASKSSLNFATALIGSTHSQTFTLTNMTDGSSGAITIDSLSAPWSSSGCYGSDLAPTNTCTVTINYSPTTVGNSSATFKATGAASPATSRNVSLSANATKITSANSIWDFGDVGLNTPAASGTIRISNPSNLDDATSCSVSVDSPFTKEPENCTGTIAKNSYCEITIGLPSQSTEELITGKKLTVACTVGGTVEVNLRANIKNLPLASLTGNSSFGDVDLGKNGLSRTFTLTNSNGTSINIGSAIITGSSDYTITSTTCGASLADGASCTYSVKLDPAALGSNSATFSVGISDANRSGSLTANLSGTGTQMSLAVSPEALTFKDIEIGTADSQTKTITLTNNGTRTANLSYTSLTSPYSKSGACGATLSAGASCTMDVKCEAAAKVGEQNQTLTSTDTLNGNTTSVSSSLACKTINAAKFAIKDDRAQTTFTNSNITLTDITGDADTSNNIVDLSPASRTATFTIKNDSALPAFNITGVTVSLVKNSGPSADPDEHIITTTNSTCGIGDKTKLEPGEECIVEVKYKPTAVRETVSNYTLTASGNINGNAVSIKSLEIRGRSYKGATLSSNVSDYNFGLIASNTNLDSTDFTLSNDGDVKATNLAMNFSGTSSPYAANFTQCGSELLGNSSCTFKVNFKPNTVALATKRALDITSTQSSISNAAFFKGASFIDDQTDNAAYPLKYGYEPEIASDENYFYVVSKNKDSSTYNNLHLQICPKNSTTGNIQAGNCGSSTMTVAGEPFWAGDVAGYKLNPYVSQNKILVASSNQQDDYGLKKGISTILICDKSKISALKTIDFSIDCNRINIHSISIDQSTGNPIGSISNLGAFTSMHIGHNKLILSAQNTDGFSITACAYDDGASISSAIGNCNSYFHKGLGADQAEYTDVAYDGSKVIMAAHKSSSPGLYAIACTLDANNRFTCGDYEAVDNTPLTNEYSRTMYPGAQPYVVIDSEGILIAHQQGSVSSQGLRLSKCSILEPLKVICSNKTVAASSGTVGLGLNPSLKVVKRGATRIAWIQSVMLTNTYENLSEGQKKLVIYTCDLTNFDSSSCTLQFNGQSLTSTASIYAREMDIDISRNIITIPFTTRSKYRTGFLTMGLWPEL